jgi:hypothetical protein
MTGKQYMQAEELERAIQEFRRACGIFHIILLLEIQIPKQEYLKKDL